MRTTLALMPLALAAQLLTGCGAAAVQSSTVHLTSAELGSMTVGEPRILSSQMNPTEPISASAAGDAIAVTFARRGQEGNVIDVDPDLGHTRSSTQYRYESVETLPTLPTMGAERVALAAGGSLLLWTEGSTERGHRAMAQSIGADGTPRSAPIAILPAMMDVIGSPHAATTDGHHVVVTFAASEREKGFELVAVPIDVL